MLGSLWIVGLLVSSYGFYRVAWWAYTTFVRHVDLRKYRKGQSWAIITGATDGIGLAYAIMLAEHHFNILLVSRNQEKLETVKKRITDSYKIRVDYVVSNANDTSESNIQKIVEEVGSRDVAILVNNVGIGQGGVNFLHQLDSKQIEECIRVNCTYPTLLTKSILPILLRHDGPKLMINVSSVAALIMNPFSSIYSGSKAFNRQFSRALTAEYHSKQLDVLCVEPGFVESNMTKMKPNLFCCTARECVESSLRKIGDIEVIPHWKHTLMYILSMLVTSLPNPIMPVVIFKLIESVRQKTGRLGKE